MSDFFIYLFLHRNIIERVTLLREQLKIIHYDVKPTETYPQKGKKK